MNIADYRCHAFEYNRAATSRCDKCDKNGNKLLYKCIEHLKLICAKCVEEGLVDPRHVILLNIGHDELPQPILQEPRKQAKKRKSSKGPNGRPQTPKKPNQGRQRHLNIVQDEEDQVQKGRRAQTSTMAPRGKQTARISLTHELQPISSRTRTSSAQLLPGIDETTPCEESPKSVSQEAAVTTVERFSSNARDVLHDSPSSSYRGQQAAPVESSVSATTDKMGLAFLLRAAEIESPEMMDVDDRTSPTSTMSPNIAQKESPRSGSTIDYNNTQAQSTPNDSGPQKDIYSLRVYSPEGTFSAIDETTTTLPFNQSRNTAKSCRPQHHVRSTQHIQDQQVQDPHRPPHMYFRPSQQEASQPKLGPSHTHDSTRRTVRDLHVNPTRNTASSYLPSARDHTNTTHRRTLEPYRSEYDTTRSHSPLAHSASTSSRHRPQPLPEVPSYDAQPRSHHHAPSIISSGFTPINAGRPRSIAALTQYVINTPLSHTRSMTGPATHLHLAINAGHTQTLEAEGPRSIESELSPIPTGAITAFEAKAQEMEDQIVESQHEAYTRSENPQNVETRVVAKRLKVLLRQATIVKKQGGVYSGSEMKRRR